MIRRARSSPRPRTRFILLGGPLSLALALSLAGVIPARESAPENDSGLDARVDRAAPQFTRIADQIWQFAELGYLETRSSTLLQSELAARGFRITTGVGGIPTAFIAEWGAAGPVIGLLSEFDALPGMAQDAVPVRQTAPTFRSGHACGAPCMGSGR